jgi:hypothetical protein
VVSEALSLGIARLGREADQSPLSSAEVKNAWSYSSTPQYAFIAVCLFKAQWHLKYEERKREIRKILYHL